MAASTARILIVDADAGSNKLLSAAFANSGYQCAVLSQGNGVLDYCRSHSPDLIVLEVELPDRNGLDICRDLQADSDVPIMLLSTRIDEVDRLLGLELGADDYICKPFFPREVVARAKAVLRRMAPQQRNTCYQVGRVSIDLAAHQALLDEQPLSLTPLEFEVLKLLVSKPQSALSRTQLYASGLGVGASGDERSMDTHVKNLRKKLRGLLGGDDPFRTVYGFGYALNQAAFLPDQS